jgi:hypothetical protein
MGISPGRRGCYHPRPPQIRTRRFLASGSSRESFADDVMDDHIGRSAHRHSLLGQTFSVSHQFGYPCRIVDTGYRAQSPPVFLDMVLYWDRNDIPLCSGLQVCSPPRSFLPLRVLPQGSRGFYIRAYRALLPPHAADMLTVRTQVIDGTGTCTLSDSQPCRLLTHLATPPFPPSGPSEPGSPLSQVL